MYVIFRLLFMSTKCSEEKTIVELCMRISSPQLIYYYIKQGFFFICIRYNIYYSLSEERKSHYVSMVICRHSIQLEEYKLNLQSNRIVGRLRKERQICMFKYLIFSFIGRKQEAGFPIREGADGSSPH
jgi:hypothetical protein